MNNFPVRLKQAMRIRGLRQTDLAEKTGIEHGTISNYVNGKYKPKAKNVILIADALKVNTPWLLGVDDVPMDIDPSVDYYVSEDDIYARAYLKLEYSDIVQMNISKEEWVVLYDKFEKISDSFKTDILKYMYLVFAMDGMINGKEKKGEWKDMLFHSILCILASCAIGYILLLVFYWRQMHAIVDFENLVLDAPHILLILAIIGLILSFF